jgi:hypothetical protein
MQSHLERVFRDIAFWAATALSVTFLVVVIMASVWAYFYVRAHSPPVGGEHMGFLAVTYGVLLIIAGAVFSGVFFGWRRERQEVRQLQQQVADLRTELM